MVILQVRALRDDEGDITKVQLMGYYQADDGELEEELTADEIREVAEAVASVFEDPSYSRSWVASVMGAGDDDE